MSSNQDDAAGRNPDDGVYRTSASLPRAFLGNDGEAGGVSRNVALAVLLSATAGAIAVVLLALLATHPAGEVQVARSVEIVP